MKKTLTLLIVVLVAGCAGPGGPAQRTGRSVDHGVEKVGMGVEKVGDKIKDSAR